MKISILLPYKENFSPLYPGAISIFLHGIINKLTPRESLVKGTELSSKIIQKIGARI